MKSKKNNILCILHFPPPIHGSSVVGKQIKDSKKINEKFIIDYINLGTSDTVDSIGSFNLKKIITYLKILFSVFRKNLFNNYDLVYIAPTVSSGGFYKDFIVVFLVKLLHKKKIVFHQHNKGVSLRKDNKLIHKMYSFFYKNTYVILLSELLFKDISEFVPKKNVFICPNGISPINFKQEIKEKNNDTSKILFLSNLIESKGVYVLLDACKLLKDKGLSFKCYFVGGEGDITKEEFETKIEKYNLNNNVFYLGKKYKEEKHNIFSESDIFVFPTFYHNECFPLVCLEAMQYSLPVISTNEGGIPDIIDNGVNGFIIPKNDVEELSHKIEKLITNRELSKEFGEKGYKKFIQKYTVEEFEERLYNIFLNLL